MPDQPALLNVSTQERVALANEVVAEIETRLASSRSKVGVRVKYSPKDFEFDISRTLTALFPLCVISNVRYFSPSILERKDYGNEIDNVFHVSNTDHEYIVIVEAKKQAIEVRRSDRWMATYPDGVSNVVEKANTQMRTLLEFLGFSETDSEIKFLYYVVSSDDVPEIKKTDGHMKRRSLFIVL